jgi:hypothetical protein
LRPGQGSSWSLPSGLHHVNVNKTGVSGFFSGIVGAKEVINMSISVAPGEILKFDMGYRQQKCGGACGSRRTRVLFLEESPAIV